MKIGVTGCAGRMGKMLCQAVIEAGLELSGGTERPESPVIGQELGKGKVFADIKELFAVSDAVLDFTAPAASVANAKAAAETGKVLVIGTTGLTEAQRAEVAKAAEKAPIVLAPNMSVGVNLLQVLVEKVASILDPAYDIEIVEMHHRNKVDAPSGTALALGKAAAKGRGESLDKVACYERHGVIGARPAGEIGFATLRGGDVVGDHTVIFAGTGERIELTHKASSRAVFANGAVRAALWAAGQKAGLYSMRDVLGF